MVRPEPLRRPRVFLNLSAWRMADSAPLSDFKGRWQRQGDLRFRVSCLHPIGGCYPSEMGTLYRMGGLERVDRAARFPKEFGDGFPIYMPQSPVDYEVEIENAGESLQAGLRIETVQEDFNWKGGPSRVLGEATAWSVPSLRPGERIVLKGMIRMSAHGQGRTSNFEQTHLTVLGEGQALVDAPNAGIVDPPDWLN